MNCKSDSELRPSRPESSLIRSQVDRQSKLLEELHTSLDDLTNGLTEVLSTERDKSKPTNDMRLAAASPLHDVLINNNSRLEGVIARVHDLYARNTL